MYLSSGFSTRCVMFSRTRQGGTATKNQGMASEKHGTFKSLPIQLTLYALSFAEIRANHASQPSRDFQRGKMTIKIIKATSTATAV